jgi:hypothetical protein
VTLKTKSIISLKVRVTDNLIMLRAPVQKPFISYGLTLGTLPLVVRTDKFTEVLAVGEVKGNIGGIKSLLKAFEFPFKDVQYNAEVTGNGD